MSDEELIVTTNREPIGTPEPPHETDLGKDSIPADDVAAVQEDALVDEELRDVTE